MPVTTTRLLKLPPFGWSRAQAGSSRHYTRAPRPTILLRLRVPLDVLDGFLHAGDLLGVLVGNLDAELLFEGHHELDRVERVRAQVVDERGVDGDFLLVDSELLDDDFVLCKGMLRGSLTSVFVCLDAATGKLLLEAFDGLATSPGGVDSVAIIAAACSLNSLLNFATVGFSFSRSFAVSAGASSVTCMPFFFSVSSAALAAPRETSR